MKKVVILGGGPSGLAASYNIQKNNLKSFVLEAESQVGGISKTINYKDYYFDLGGHRFFSKSSEVNILWKEILAEKFRKTPRLSRIYYKNKFFNYPLTPLNAFFGVGIKDFLSIILSYFKVIFFPCKLEETFEQWVSNRFGKKLYLTFFKTYTEKVWGIPCDKIQAEWAAQRIKGLSLKSAILNAFIKSGKNKIKTLIDEFDYPVLGPGQMYTEMKNKIEEMGGQVLLNSKVTGINHQDFVVKSIEYMDNNNKISTLEGTDFISSIPITELIGKLTPKPPEQVINAAKNLKYRSIIIVEIIVNKESLFPDNWIYIHSPEVKLGRIQNFKNWSMDMIPDKSKTSLGLEYFCDEHDNMWNMSDEQIFKLASLEIEKIKICKASDIEDYTVVKVPKAYPVYMAGYKEYIDIIKNYLERFTNIQLIGRYGLFKYNNMDHSILTGLYASYNIIDQTSTYDTWSVNTDEEYHEEATND